MDTGGGFGSALIDTTVVDDDWSAGYVGLFRGTGSGATQQFDDFQVGYDNNADLDIADPGDDIQIDDDFNSNAVTLSYDDNGNLTDDGVYKYVYDAWNRLVKVTRRVDAFTTVAEYAYDGANRRTKKVVSNCGVENTANDGGNTTVHFYYDHQWRIVETRNGSNQSTWQYVWGTQYRDEIILADKQGDGSGNDCDPDNTAGGETANLDHRYFFHQDRNGNVTA